MKRTIGLVVLAGLLTTSVAWAQNKNAVIGSKHDIATQGCKSCHASHSGSANPTLASTTTTPDASTGQILLWDRNFPLPTTLYGTYDSPSMRSKGIAAVDISGTRPAATDAKMQSVLCMSCHDGITSTAVLSPTDPDNIGSDKTTVTGGNCTLTTNCGLTNDHPINVAQDNTRDTNLLAPTDPVFTSPTGLRLYTSGTMQTVQCASCHNVHNPNTANAGPGYFLRMSNAGSAMCLTCHK